MTRTGDGVPGDSVSVLEFSDDDSGGVSGEEDSDESVDVPCGIFCCFNGFAVVCIGEPDANSKKPRTVR